MKKIFLSFALFFCACGYTPLNVATSNVLGDDVCVKTLINKADPRNSLILNDNFIDYLQHYLHKNIVDDADTKITLKVLNSDFVVLYYDELGYAKSYKAIILLEFEVTLKNKETKIIQVSGEHIFNTNSISVLSDEQKSRAINLASKKAFDEFALMLNLK
ncbi:hypothetical protein [Campylobacter sp. MG1]|uniref:hypothetical protein n=1 Tax=Campylobacter sp. MG1 TaxID=2976332 RepID=UPI00226CBC80|nr:hypothetical protein [Campylobacter sp. MG1]